jgi:hypothetical protein
MASQREIFAESDPPDSGCSLADVTRHDHAFLFKKMNDPDASVSLE